MSTRFHRKQEILDWIKWNTRQASDLSEIVNLAPEIREKLMSVEDDNWVFYDNKTDTIKICDVELTHTSAYERAILIENLRAGDKLGLKATGDDLVVVNNMGSEVGNLSINDNFREAVKCNDFKNISVVATNVLPKSARGKGAKKAILNVTVEATFLPIDRTGTNCIFVVTEGDQIQGWHQKVDVIYSNMKLEDAKALFEIHNRANDEYNEEKTDVGYAGLDNLVDEINEARLKMRKEKTPGVNYSEITTNSYDFMSKVKVAIKENPGRYGNLLKYVDRDQIEYADFDVFYKNTAIDMVSYYWEDQVRCSQSEYEAVDFYHHLYTVVELFAGDKLPIDFEDEDVVSAFGTKEFVAFADMSYGC